MSLDLDSLRVFVRVAELQSFTQAAQQLGIPKARASAQVQRLERDLATQLFLRSTRVVRLTPEGEQLLARARDLLAESEDIEGLFRPERSLQGRVRLDLPVFLAREYVIPRIPDLLALHPKLRLEISATDRMVAAQREGFDVVLRIGAVDEPSLVGRRIGEFSMMNVASPAYVKRYGTPRTPDDLREHYVVHYANDRTPVFEYFDGRAYQELAMRSLVTVDTSEAYGAAAVAGLGIVQLPRHDLSLHGGKLVEVAPDLVARPMPITVLHTHGGAPPRRVRAVINWLIEQLSPVVRAMGAEKKPKDRTA